MARSDALKRGYLIAFSISIVFILMFSGIGYSYEMYENKGRRYYEQTGEVVWEIKTNEKIVAITFDDGPDAKYTSQVLDLLAEYGAKATFFIIGKNAEKNPEVVLRQYEEGHELANHTYTHPWTTSTIKLDKELKQTNEVIFSITGFRPTLFRPVGGQYTDAMIDTAVKNGFKVVMWSWHQDTEDWANPGVKKIVSKVLKGTRPGDVVLFHDAGGDRSQTIKALEEILPELKRKGYHFVTISELLEYQNENNNKNVQ